MRPIGPRIVIRRLDMPRQKSSILEIVEYNPEPSQFGVVLAVGEWTLRNGEKMPVEVKPGDTVIVRQFSGAPAKVDFNGEEEEVYFMMPDDVLAIVEV